MSDKVRQPSPALTAQPGRPSRYSPALAGRICAQLAAGRSLRTVCADPEMPCMSTVFSWLQQRPEFLEQHTYAKAESADALVEEILDIADDATNDWMAVHDKEGNAVGYKLNGEHVQRSRLRIDARKLIAAKLKPKKYGDRALLETETPTTDPLQDLIRALQGTALNPIERPDRG